MAFILLSGLLYGWGGMFACFAGSAVMLLVSLRLPEIQA
jgi:hypothetical protein